MQEPVQELAQVHKQEHKHKPQPQFTSLHHQQLELVPEQAQAVLLLPQKLMDHQTMMLELQSQIQLMLTEEDSV